MPPILEKARIGVEKRPGGDVMRVKDVMTADVATTTPDAPLKEAALELVRRRISGMPVVDAEAHVVGVVSEADIVAKEGDEQKQGGFLQWLVDPADPWISARFDAVTVGQAMSTPARTIAPERTIAEAATLMLDENVNRLPVVDADGKLIGLLSRGDLVRAFVRSDEEILREIEDDVIRRVMWLNPGEVEVTVADGMVTLTGEVASEADADLLPTFARRVPGVVGVTSTLTHRG
jgi:CBS domain-containing protein